MPVDHITIEELRKAHHAVAQLVMIDHVYLPIFKRLKDEIAAKELEVDLIDEARAVVNG
jgi:hypothetical protein